MVQMLKNPVTQCYTGHAVVKMQSHKQAEWVASDLNEMIFTVSMGPRPLQASVAQAGQWHTKSNYHNGHICHCEMMGVDFCAQDVCLSFRVYRHATHPGMLPWAPQKKLFVALVRPTIGVAVSRQCWVAQLWPWWSSNDAQKHLAILCRWSSWRYGNNGERLELSIGASTVG